MSFEGFKYTISIRALADELNCSQEEARCFVDQYKCGNFLDLQDWSFPTDNIDFEVPARIGAWQQNYMLLKEYLASTGQFPGYRAVYKGVRIGTWLNNQKQIHRVGKLSPTREALLRSLGVEFKSREEKGYVSLEDRIAGANAQKQAHAGRKPARQEKEL